MTIAIIIGLFFALFCNWFLLKGLIRALWKNANIKRLSRYDTQTMLLGTVDAIFYFIIFYLIIVNFSKINLKNSQLLTVLGGWLVIKALPSIWENKAQQNYDKFCEKRKKGTGGERYNIYLIGTMINILLALSGVFLSILLVSDQSTHSSFFSIILPTDVTILILFLSAPVFIWSATQLINIEPNDDLEEETDVKNLLLESKDLFIKCKNLFKKLVV